MDKQQTSESHREDSPAADAGFFDRQDGPFFRTVDWLTFWVGFIVSFGVYFHTLAPTVTLEDSGELAVASDYLGVPHPPGYPIWTLITWFFQWIFHWVKYFGTPDENIVIVLKSLKAVFTGSPEGHPNPAWSVGLMSAFFGALSCGILSILISRSGADIISSYKTAMDKIGLKLENVLCFAAGVTGGLLFAFSPVLWSQSTIVEVYSLNAFFMALTVLLLYRWMCRPKEDNILYAAAFIFGLGLTNHQTLVFIGPAILVAMWFRDRALLRDCLAGLFWLISIYMFYKAIQMGSPQGAEAIHKKQAMFTFGIIFLLLPGGLFFIERALFTEWKRFLITAGLAILGISFYAYLPVASEQNPPMNWGYPRTTEGFWHAISRGQYEKIDPIKNFNEVIQSPQKYFTLVNKIIFNAKDSTSVVAQFQWYLSFLVLIPVLFFGKISRQSRHWLIVSLIMFFFLTFFFIIFQYPEPDVQTLFIGRVQYIQAHAIFAIWISYGLIFGLSWLESRGTGNRMFTYGAALAILLLPLIPIARNAYDDKFIRDVGGCEQNGHDFGWQFGHWQLQGAEAITNEISEDERASYPTPGYPPVMETNAIFFGGTDPGRFVPTYMIYSADVRSDVYLITQNALADNTYMNVMRDLYGDTIWIPSQQDSNIAFQQYVSDVQAGRIPAGAAVSIEGGRVSVQGVQGVMTINGILAKMIFDANKHKHAFYVEESYVIPWMYPYLEPHGLIMKINREPLDQLSPEVVENDRKFWDWYKNRLTSNPKFHRDVVARKTFSKLRSAIAGLYASRRMYPESEYAFRQAISLYPLSPEANFRLADIFMQQFRFSDARQLIEDFLLEDPDNSKVASFLEQIRAMEQADNRRRELEAQLQSGADINVALELATIYRQMNLNQLFENLTQRILAQGNMPPAVILQIAQMYGEANRIDLYINTLKLYVEKEPANPRVWLDLSAAQAARNQTNEAIAALRRAVELGGEAVRDLARKDERFNNLRNLPAFKALVPQIQQPGNLPINLPGLSL